MKCACTVSITVYTPAWVKVCVIDGILVVSVDEPPLKLQIYSEIPSNSVPYCALISPLKTRDIDAGSSF